jgi:Nuclease-related domain
MELILILMAIIIFILVYRLQKIKQIGDNELSQARTESAVTLEKIKNIEHERNILKNKVAKNYENKTLWDEKKKKELEEIRNQLNTKFEKDKKELEKSSSNTRHELEKQNENLKSQINEYRKYSRNFGEITTHHILERIRKALIENGVIDSPEDLIIMGNVFIPLLIPNQDVHSRQIDHLVISKKGIYVIESKYWKGTILYGLNKKMDNEFSFILDAFYSKIKDTDEKTIVFRNPSIEGESKEMQVVSYDDPAKQVKSAAWTLNQFLKSKGINIYCTPVVYFGYQDKNFKNYSNLSEPLVYDKEKEFIDLFSNEITNKKPIEHINLLQIKNIIEEANYY